MSITYPAWANHENLKLVFQQDDADFSASREQAHGAYFRIYGEKLDLSQAVASIDAGDHFYHLLLPNRVYHCDCGLDYLYEVKPGVITQKQLAIDAMCSLGTLNARLVKQLDIIIAEAQNGPPEGKGDNSFTPKAWSSFQKAAIAIRDASIALEWAAKQRATGETK